MSGSWSAETIEFGGGDGPAGDTGGAVPVREEERCLPRLPALGCAERKARVPAAGGTGSPPSHDNLPAAAKPVDHRHALCDNTPPPPPRVTPGLRYGGVWGAGTAPGRVGGVRGRGGRSGTRLRTVRGMMGRAQHLGKARGDAISGWEWDTAVRAGRGVVATVTYPGGGGVQGHDSA